MRVLFISSGRTGGISELIKNQGDSLVALGVEVDYFLIKPGVFGYILSIFKIRKTFIAGKYSLVHAHYSLCGFTASFAGRFPLVVSLMGSDVYQSYTIRIAIKIFSKIRWNATIVKSNYMKEILNLNNLFVIPNGVDLERFKPLPADEAKQHINYSEGRKLILHFSSPNRKEKNFDLAKKAVKILNRRDVLLMQVYNVPNEDIPYYLNAAELLLLTSKWEGSPNIIKEALACNCPVVATDVGDVNIVIGQTKGCFITNINPVDISDKINTAISFAKRTDGRNRIIELGLDSITIAGKIMEIYNKVENR